MAPRTKRTGWRDRRRRCVLLSILALMGCPLPVPPAPPAPPTTKPEPGAPPPAEGLPLASHPNLRATVHGPDHVAYNPLTLDAAPRSIVLHLTNAGEEPVRANPLYVSFSATRDGVAFPCGEHASSAPLARDPEWIAPGKSFTYERDLDCALPLPGHYDVKVFVHLGEEAVTSLGDVVGKLSLDVAAGEQSPRPYPSRPGLYVMMAGDSATLPLTPEAWARGDYHVLLAVINGSARTLPVGAARVAFLTYRQGSRLPCSGQSEAVAFPDELDSGRMSVVRAPVACAPSEEGRYEIVGRLTLGQEEVVAGRIALTVTRDPLMFVPDPMAPFEVRPWNRVR